MNMVPPAGGDSFVGYSGIQYTSTDGSSLQIGPADVQQALGRGWTENDAGVAGTATETPAAPGAAPWNTWD
jgi:hypothetical protein